MSGLLNQKLVRGSQMLVTILKRERRPQIVSTAIDNHHFMEAQQIYEIICYKIMENNISQRKTIMLKGVHRKIDKFVLKTTCSTTRARKITQLLVEMVATDARLAALLKGLVLKN